MNLLIHIGYHKTGTTWLRRFLFENPESGFAVAVTQSEIKLRLINPHALDFEPSQCRKLFDRSIKKIIDRGLAPVMSLERLSGNPHSGGYDSKELADRLAASFPEARILIVIREQKAMILSTYKQYVWVGGSLSLKDYLQPPPVGQGKAPLFEWDHFNYHRLIGYYQKLFGQNRVLVLPYECFKCQPAAFITEIMRFCGLEPQAEIVESLPYSTRINLSISGVSLAWKRYLNHVIGLRSSLNQHVLYPVTPAIHRKKLKPWWYRLDAVMPSALKRRSDQKLKGAISDLVGSRYRNSNRLTAEMLNLDLSPYGYDLP